MPNKGFASPARVARSKDSWLMLGTRYTAFGRNLCKISSKVRVSHTLQSIGSIPGWSRPGKQTTTASVDTDKFNVDTD